jgi:hypothetical protein
MGHRWGCQGKIQGGSIALIFNILWEAPIWQGADSLFRSLFAYLGIFSEFVCVDVNENMSFDHR